MCDVCWAGDQLDRNRWPDARGAGRLEDCTTRPADASALYTADGNRSITAHGMPSGTSLTAALAITEIDCSPGALSPLRQPRFGHAVKKMCERDLSLCPLGFSRNVTSRMIHTEAPLLTVVCGLLRSIAVRRHKVQRGSARIMTAMRNHRGFTLLELLTVVAIVGVLAAIAIPQFALYRQKTFDARAESDLRNAAGAQEYYFASNHAYVTCTTAATCEANLPGYNRSAGINLTMTAAKNSFTGTASHSSGTKTFSYDSENGGLQ